MTEQDQSFAAFKKRKSMPWDMRFALWLLRRREYQADFNKSNPIRVEGQINLRWGWGYWESSSAFFNAFLSPSELEVKK